MPMRSVLFIFVLFITSHAIISYMHAYDAPAQYLYFASCCIYIYEKSTEFMCIDRCNRYDAARAVCFIFVFSSPLFA